MSDPARITAEATRDALARLLVGIPAAQLAAVARDVFAFLPLPTQFAWDDSGAVVTKIDSLPVQADVPPLVAFAARLAQEVEAPTSIEINRWIDGAARAADLREEVLRQLFLASRPSEGRDRYPEPSTKAYNRAKISEPDNLRNEELAVASQGAVTDHPQTTGDRSDVLRVWGGVPTRNPDFTGRETLLLHLQRSLDVRSKTSVLPTALHGFGGVGKTQLAVEYAYRFADRYDLVWWIPAEQQSLVLQSLVDLGRQLGVPVTEDLGQASALVIEALAATDRRWLLVYDNATEPDELSSLIPSSGGHVILTSRNQAWSDVWGTIEVNVFERSESVALIRKRGRGISYQDADRLAAELGDLPLALDQAASWQRATGMPVPEYLTLLDRHMSEIASAGKSVAYPAAIAAQLKLAYQRLQKDAPAVAQLLEMFAVFGAEPISVELLRRGRKAAISEPLGGALGNEIRLGRTVRDLRRHGLAKVDAESRIQVHRLFQLVLRDELSPEQGARSRANVHRLLGAANPGYPDDVDTSRTHAEIGPHVLPSGLIAAETEEGRRVVLDQIRYLWIIGDYEGSRRLGEAAVRAWSPVTDQSDIGPDGELTLLASRHLANALLSLGINERARDLAEATLARFRQSPQFGPNHEHTLSTAGPVSALRRVAGELRLAYELDTETVRRCREVFGDEDPETLRSQGNLAVNLRLLSRFQEAFDLDTAIVRAWEETVTEQNRQLLFAQANLARDLYGLGRWNDALALQQRILPPFRRIMVNPKHPHVLWAARTLAMTLRKTGHYEQALREARENYRDCWARYGPDHEHSLAATMTYANTLRAVGQLSEASSLVSDALSRYGRAFGDKHPLYLTAAINYAVILRLQGDLDHARRLDESSYRVMVSTLGVDHGYTLCAASNLANDRALAGEHRDAQLLSAETLAISRQSRGPDHPYTTLCWVNSALDLLAVGETDRGRVELAEAVDALSRGLGEDHPETLDARRGKRAECDIEPPPT